MPVVDFHLHGSFAKFLEQYGSAESYLRVLDDAGANYGVIPAGSGTLEEVYAGPNPTDVVRSFAISGRKRTGRPTASFSSGMSTIRPRIETPSLSRTTAMA